MSTNPWALLVMGNLLLVAGLAMLDVIPVRLPASLSRRAATAGTGGRVAGAFVMGAMSGLVAAPCSAPVMAAVVAGIGCRQGLLVGGDVQSLGQRVTAAVVHAIFAIIMLDAAFALLYMQLDV